MPTRRSFLQSTAAMAAALSGASTLESQALSRASGGILTEPATSRPTAPVQVPRMKFLDTEISRMVLGVNP
ncbi:MAG TPA: twin-arginine translocation signal domain-containing protein, partial [Anaerolineales bacterium]|nr:twin-arginine translocation signal domain-containing protein [Anaerolineales bacterium]